LENTPLRSTEEHGLVRGFGLLQATALNMSNMVGVGPFITIPLIIAAMGGPQLEIASGYIGVSQYVGYFWHGMGPTETRLVSLAVVQDVAHIDAG
jgi:hypothetical protein